MTARVRPDTPARRRYHSGNEQTEVSSMIPQPPPGQGPVDPRGAFSPPLPPGPGFGGNAPQRAPSANPLPLPGYFPPPMMMAPPPPPYYPPPRRSFAGIVFGTLASVIFGFSLMLNVYLGLATLARSADPIKQETLIDGDASQRIAVYPLHSVIGSEEASLFEKYLAADDKDVNIKAIA